MNDKNKFAMQPPMGWNSWDCYAATVTEKQLLDHARFMAEKLRSFGWEYIICDIQWYEPLAGAGEGEYRPFAELCMDEYSRLLPAENRFPSSAGGKGFAPVAEKIHNMGLKFGLHYMRGIPRQAVHRRSAVKSVHDITAEKIANPFSICKWNSDMYGVDSSKPGAQDYYNSVFEQFAEWGVDYVKVDDICNTNMYPHAPYSGEGEIELIHNAIINCGRPMVLSLSPGPAIIDKAWHLSRYANMWRITDDFWDHWELLKDMFRRCELWQSHVKPGCWPDCDMLPLGRIGIGFKNPHNCNFTRDEQRTMMTLWCIFRSPLMMGGVLAAQLPSPYEIDDWTLSLLTNDEVLSVQRYGEAPKQIALNDKESIWINSAPDGKINLALFNLSDEKRTVCCALSELGYSKPAKASLRDLWNKKDIENAADEVKAEIPPHGSVLYSLA
ncbi:MAG: glycoside hydrolase family 27 protein [Treponema sp.]|nr:glycoside hydrolase family 27 protein [Treponema sp.]